MIGRWAVRLGSTVASSGLFVQRVSSSACSVDTLRVLEQALIAAVRSRTYQQIPDLLSSAPGQCRSTDVFSFLAELPDNARIRVVAAMLHSFIPIRPRSRSRAALSCLLLHTLKSPDPFPLVLAILQRTIRSGCVPYPETSVLIPTVWSKHFLDSQSISEALASMKSIGYSPDTGTCNYVVSVLCAADQLEDAMKVLKGMTRAGCIPDSDTYGTIISKMCGAGRGSDAMDMIKKMVKAGVMPRQGTVEKVAAALKSRREAKKGVDMIDFLEKENCSIEFEVYDIVVGACLQSKEHILAAKVVMRMTSHGFIPYIKVRQKVIYGLASIGEIGLLRAIRQRLTELGS